MCLFHSDCMWDNADAVCGKFFWTKKQHLKKSYKSKNTSTHINVDFLFHSKPHSGKEIFNFPTPVNMLFYLSSFDLQTGQSCALGDTVQKGDWVVGVFCFKGMLASNGTYLMAISYFKGAHWGSLRPPQMELKQDQCLARGLRCESLKN